MGNKMIVDAIQVAPGTEIHRTRQLPVAGRVLVKKDQKVASQDVIAEASIPGGVVMLDIARGLGLPAQEVRSCLVREKGELLKEGDVIAKCEGAFPRLVRAPVEGIFLEYHQGQAALATGSSQLALSAGMIGEVDSIIAGFGVRLSARGSLVQGVWGNGKMGQGAIKVLDDSLEKPIKAAVLKKSTGGQVIAGGMCLHAEVLHAARSAEISGLVVGSLAPELLTMVNLLPFPVIVLQGFGAIPPDPMIFGCLKDRSGDTAALNAQAVDVFRGERPEMIIPHETLDISPELNFREPLKVGRRVRVMSGMSLGQTGEVIELLESSVQFESGLELPAVLIEMTSGDKVTIPTQNVVIVS